MQSVVQKVEAHRSVAVQAHTWLLRSALARPPHFVHACIGVGRPSVGGRRTVALRQRLLQRPRGLSVLRRPARRWFASHSPHWPRVRLCATAVPSLKHSTKAHGTPPGARSVSPRSRVSLSLRGIVECRCVAFGMVVPSAVSPNPSVERTHNGGARLLASPALAAPLCAAHLKR